jgi:hypothetical protein
VVLRGGRGGEAAAGGGGRRSGRRWLRGRSKFVVRWRYSPSPLLPSLRWDVVGDVATVPVGISTVLTGDRKLASPLFRTGFFPGGRGHGHQLMRVTRGPT